jgi:hypothetical protein
MVVVPYEWVWIVGSCLLSFNLRLFHDELVEGARIPFFSLFPLFSIPIDPERCGLSPLLVWCCFSFNSIPLIPVVAMACGSKESESCVFTRLLVVVLNPCMLVPL